MDKFKQFISFHFKYHLAAGLLIRLLLIVYGEFHDKFYDVPFTDIDYKVFTDAARHVVNGYSPYRRHTYRYSPIIAYLLVPNIVIGRNFGKILFSVCDLFVSIAISTLVRHQLLLNYKNYAENISKYCALFWIYNPMSIAISSRGNADSFPCFFIILSIMFLQTNVAKGLLKFAISGFLLGVSIHLRIYPLAFSFPMYLSLGDYKITRNTRILEGIIALIPNKKQNVLTFSCLITLSALTSIMYWKYGYEFVFETYIYHLFRKDTRHNFSVLFYYSYLTMDQLSFNIVKTIAQIFECVILFIISLTFGCESKTLPFALFCQSVILVAFNSVMTSQYFIWFLSLLPLVVHDFKMVPAKAMWLTVVWTAAQGAWLFYAYLLEFKCRDVFILIWLKGVVFFCANIFILGQLIKCYSPGFGFGVIKLDTKKK